MKDDSRFRLRRSMLGAGLLAGLSPLGAQNLPSSGSTPIISTGSPGSAMDYVARWLAEQFAMRLGGSYPVETMQGAGGAMAAGSLLTRSAGSSLLVAHSGLLCTYPVLNADSLTFHPKDDLVPVGIPVGTPMFVATGSNSGITDVAQLKIWRGRQLHYAANQIGGVDHLSGLLLLDTVQVDPVPVLYAKVGQAALDVAEGRVPLGVFSWQSIRPLVEAGRVSILCVLSERRVPFAAQMTTAKELGINVSIEGWIGLFVRQGTLELILQAHANAMDEFMSGPAAAHFLSAGGLSKLHVRRPESVAFVSKEINRYASLIKRYNIKKT